MSVAESGVGSSTARLLTHVALKKSVLNASVDVEQQKKLHKRYDGQAQGDALSSARRYAEEFYVSKPDVDDPEGLKRICEHRRIMDEIGLQSKRSAPSALLARVDALEDPNSNDVVHLEDGGASFSIPGGYGGLLSSTGHAIAYEVKMLKNEKGESEYFVVVHNRGAGLEDARIHGDITVCKKGDLDIYSKTSVSIKVDKELLTEEFFKDLIKSGTASSMKEGYDCLETHLLKRGGEIQTSAQEKEFRSALTKYNEATVMLDACDEVKKAFGARDSGKLSAAIQALTNSKAYQDLSANFTLQEKIFYQLLFRQIQTSASALEKGGEMPDALRDGFSKLSQRITDGYNTTVENYYTAADTLIEKDDSYNSCQTYGTCTESNRGSPEKQMASKKTRMMLKQDTIQRLTEDLKNSRMFSSTKKQQLLQLGETRQQRLQEKIAQQQGKQPGKEQVEDIEARRRAAALGSHPL